MSAVNGNTDKIMTMRELAEYARVTTRTLQNWKGLGMPYLKVAGSVRVRLSDFDSWMDGFRLTDNTPPEKELDEIWRETVEEVKKDEN